MQTHYYFLVGSGLRSSVSFVWVGWRFDVCFLLLCRSLCVWLLTRRFVAAAFWCFCMPCVVWCCVCCVCGIVSFVCLLFVVSCSLCCPVVARVCPRGAACSNSRPQPGAKTFRGLEGGGGVLVGQPVGRRGPQGVPNIHTSK